MGIKRKHKKGQIRDVEFIPSSDNCYSRYQQALSAIDSATRESQPFSDAYSSKD
jgi:hypothetical protein